MRAKGLFTLLLIFALFGCSVWSGEPQSIQGRSEITRRSIFYSEAPNGAVIGEIPTGKVIFILQNYQTADDWYPIKCALLGDQVKWTKDFASGQVVSSSRFESSWQNRLGDKIMVVKNEAPAEIVFYGDRLARGLEEKSPEWPAKKGPVTIKIFFEYKCSFPVPEGYGVSSCTSYVNLPAVTGIANEFHVHMNLTGFGVSGAIVFFPHEIGHIIDELRGLPWDGQLFSYSPNSSQTRASQNGIWVESLKLFGP